MKINTGLGMRIELKSMYLRQDKWIYVLGIDLKRLANYPGCYVVFRIRTKRPVYIGHSNRPNFRIRQHIFQANKIGMETPWGSFRNIFIKVKYPSEYGYEAMLEKRLIRRFKPEFNKQMLKSKKVSF